MREMFRTRFTEPRMEAGGDEAEIMLYGEIVQDMPEEWKWSREDKSASEFDRAIKEVKGQGAKRIHLRINSPGGVVWEAVAMRTILTGAGFEGIRISVEGICASAATILASIPGAVCEIAEGASYMIHNPWTFAAGNAMELEEVCERLRKDEANIRGLYAKKCGKDDDTIRAWMEAETWFTAQEAVENGFCDKIKKEECGQAAACVSEREYLLMQSLYRHAPDMKAYREEKNITVVPAEAAVAAAAGSDNKKNIQEETERMDFTQVTVQMLKDEAPELYASVISEGAKAERERISEIDALTDAGYEAMAKEAKEKGESPADFMKAVIAAKREKGARVMEARAQETKAAEAVEGESAEDKAEEDNAQEKRFMDTVANYAKSMKRNHEGMF